LRLSQPGGPCCSIYFAQEQGSPVVPPGIGLSLDSEVEVEVKLRPTVSRPARLGVRHPSGTRNQFFFLFEIFFKQLRVCYFVVILSASVCSHAFHTKQRVFPYIALKCYSYNGDGLPAFQTTPVTIRTTVSNTQNSVFTLYIHMHLMILIKKMAIVFLNQKSMELYLYSSGIQPLSFSYPQM
jgi:hypothetical protein